MQSKNQLYPSTLHISVALCTYNGSAFLSSQLESIQAQTRLPYELIVCDDGSTDSTLSILENFAAQSPFPVRVFRNQQHLGISANFERAINLCEGNFIALCDQDDVWQSNKLDLFAKVFLMGNSWVCCDAEVCDQNLNSLGYSLWELVRFDHNERSLARKGRFFDILLKHYVVAGATLAFSAQTRDHILPIPQGWYFDAWFSIVLAATQQVSLKETTLQFYRQHSGNALGASRKNLLMESKAAFALDRQSYYAGEIDRWNALAIRLEILEVKKSTYSQLEAKIAHLNRRATLPKNRLARWPTVIAEIMNKGYARYSRNWGSIVFDLIVK